MYQFFFHFAVRALGYVDTRRKQAKIKLILLVLYKKMKMKNGVMGSSRPFAQKNVYNSFREELAYLDVTF